MGRKYALIDLWVDKLPDFFAPGIRWLQSLGLTVILAHPERMRAVQDGPKICDYFAKLGILLQGNLGCFSDSPEAYTRRTAERLLAEDRYFMVGSDLHSIDTLPPRMEGLKRLEELAGPEKTRELNYANPMKLMSE
jgi:tyrosine-protein phosphatase YwqE